MKDSITLFFLVFTVLLHSQNFESDLSAEISAEAAVASTYIPAEPSGFEEVAYSKGIPQKTFVNIEDAESGFYVISGIFSDEDNTAQQVKKLREEGFESGFIQNPDNTLFYVYLDRYGSWDEAFQECATQFDNRYKEEVWVLQIKNDVQEDLMGATPMIKASVNDTETTDSETISNDPSSKSKLLTKADDFFDRMWYAEAAELYERALAKDKANYTDEILRKVGDAHYFNTDMEKAYAWYNVLYEKYEDELPSETMFKYAHTLKGMGNYKRSKRLMKLYSKNTGDEIPDQNEKVLDGLLSMEDRFTIDNLDVNSEYSDFSPMFYNDEEVVYASSKDSSFYNTRRYKWNDQPFLDLFVAKVNEESQQLKDALKFSKKINTKYHEASVTFSPDNETMYFTRNNYGKKLKRDQNGINHLKIYRSQKIDGEWGEAEEVSFSSDAYSTGHPALSKDGKQLYFVSDMPGSIGETDIFVVDVREDGSFSTPKNLGPEINTEHKEMFPFINNEKLYFSSNGHVGLGGLDVFEVAFDTENGFLEVRNVGKPINSEKDDFSFIVNEDTQKGYFASNRAGGKGDDDIYSFKTLEIEEVPTNENAIAGIVTELITGEFMPNALVELLDENNIKLKEMQTDENGNFIFEDLESNKRYIIRTKQGSFEENDIEVKTVDNQLVNVDVTMKRLNDMIAVENGIRKLKTEMIHFDFDKSYIRDDAALELDKLVQVMNESPNMVIKIESHTDSRGSDIYNKYLSERRAKSTREYLIANGIDESRIESAIGYGEERLLNECDGNVPCSEQQHYLNRRSEFIIVDM